MKRTASFPATLAAVLLSACDWDQRALLDSIPVSRDYDEHPSFHVFLGVDGVSREALDEARAQGAFADFSVGTMIPMFPATSDASWSRILRAPPVRGYELTYFDAQRDELMNGGVAGIVGHALPPSMSDDQFPYYRAFDFHGAGYLDAVEDYAAPEQAFNQALEDLFSVMGGRLGRADVFTGYLVEADVAAHGKGKEVMVKMLLALSKRMAEFQERHHRYTIAFTLVSDHGSDHVTKTLEVDAVALSARVGVKSVASWREGAGVSDKPWAVVVEHTKTTYGVMHTPAAHASDVARLVSADEVVDSAIGLLPQPEGAPLAELWVSMNRQGRQVGRFGYMASTGRYWIERTPEWASFGFALPGGDDEWVSMSEGELYEATAQGPYPDLFYRSRTALQPISIENPAQVLYSLRSEAVMRGISVPGASALGGSGSHGALGGGGSRGMMMSQAVAVPALLRSDDVLSLIPDVKDYVAEQFVRQH